MRVILIDTGIDCELNEGYIVGGANLINPNQGFDDDNGHGSLCCSIISLYSQSMPYWYPIKILNKQNESSTKILVEALNYTKNLDIRLINLSLSTLDANSVMCLTSIVSELYELGKIIVASVPNSRQTGYPASLKNVIGVDGAIFKGNTEFWYNKDYRVQCIANRIPIMVRGCQGKFNMFGGTSKATAVMTAIIGNMLEIYPDISYNMLQELLMDISIRKSWDMGELDGLSKYSAGTENVFDDREKRIEEVLIGYLSEKGLLFSMDEVNKYGYQKFLSGEDFYHILRRLECVLEIKLPKYEGIDYRVFDNPRNLKQFFAAYT